MTMHTAPKPLPIDSLDELVDLVIRQPDVYLRYSADPAPANTRPRLRLRGRSADAGSVGQRHRAGAVMAAARAGLDRPAHQAVRAMTRTRPVPVGTDRPGGRART